MMDKFMSYSLDTLTIFAEWVGTDNVALTFAALIIMCSVAVIFKQLLD